MIKIDTCPECFRSFEQNKRGSKRFCSNACKQANFRRNLNDKALSNGEIHPDPKERAKIAKSENEKTKVCRYCRKYFYINGFQGKKQYCSDKCRQAYWKAWNEPIQETRPIQRKRPIQKAPVTTEIDIRAMLETVMIEQSTEESI